MIFTKSVIVVLSSNKLDKCLTPETPISLPFKSSLVIVRFSLIIGAFSFNNLIDSF